FWREGLAIEARRQVGRDAAFEQRSEQPRVRRTGRSREQTPRVERRQAGSQALLDGVSGKRRQWREQELLERRDAAPSVELREHRARLLDARVGERPELGEDAQADQGGVATARFPGLERFVEGAVVRVADLGVARELDGERHGARRADEAEVGGARRDGRNGLAVAGEAGAAERELADGERLADR